MNPELKERLDQAAVWHECSALADPFKAPFHNRIASDIRAAIVSADDATKNMLILRAHKAKDRRFSGESITGFDELQEGSS